MQFAVQEDMLPGRTLLQKLEIAGQLGFTGVEFWAEGLTARVPEIAAAISQSGVKAAAVNFGRMGTLLTPDPAERQRVVTELRQAMANALDIGAKQVIFVPIWGEPLLPSLLPYKSQVQLEADMLVAYLRQIFTDLAYAMGAMIYMLPVNRFESHFVNRLEQAASVRRKIKNHEHVKLAASLFHMMLEETNPVQAFRDHASDIAYLYISDSNRRLPGQGLADFKPIAAALKEANYDGWLTFECGRPGQNADDSPYYTRDIPASLEFLRQAGF